MSRALLKKVLKWAVISTAILLLLVAVFWKPALQFVFHDLPFMGERFDQAVWSSALSCKNDQDCVTKEMACIRGAMYRDLAKNHLLPGTLQSTVVNLLGEPTIVDAKNGCFDYELGFCSGWKVDIDFLRVCFNGKQQVNHVSHWQG